MSGGVPRRVQISRIQRNTPSKAGNVVAKKALVLCSGRRSRRAMCNYVRERTEPCCGHNITHIPPAVYDPAQPYQVGLLKEDGIIYAYNKQVEIKPGMQGYVYDRLGRWICDDGNVVLPDASGMCQGGTSLPRNFVVVGDADSGLPITGYINTILGESRKYLMTYIITTYVTDMSSLFEVPSFIIEPTNNNGFDDMLQRSISRWDVSSVTNMNSMFKYCSHFNVDLSKWNTAKVQDMRSMFEGCLPFNRDLSKWNTAKVQNMSLMFWNAHAFDSLLKHWNTSAVTTMYGMFRGATTFPSNNNTNILKDWKTGSVTDMRAMFAGSAINQDLTAWDVSVVSWCSGFSTMDTSLWPIFSENLDCTP